MASGGRLRKARQRLRKSQAEMAVLVGVTQPRITQIEANDKVPAHLITTVAKAYGIDPLDLLPKKTKVAAA